MVCARTGRGVGRKSKHENLVAGLTRQRDTGKKIISMSLYCQYKKETSIWKNYLTASGNI